MSTTVTAVAKYAYAKHNDDELSFPKGARFNVLEKHGTGWFVVEREDTGEQGLCPGNYLRVTEVKKSPRGGGDEERKGKQPKEKRSPRGGGGGEADKRRGDEDDDEGDAPPPLPGPPPPWSDTIAGKEAARVAAQLGGDATGKAPRSPRSVVGMFGDEPSKDQAAAKFGVALKKTK